jgi:hypothetical protein
LLHEQKPRSIGGDIAWNGKVEPGKVALPNFTGSKSKNDVAMIHASEEHLSGGGDVV